MKKAPVSKRTALIAVLIIGSSAWLNAQNNNPGQATDRSVRQDQKYTNTTAGAQSAQPMKANKASSLIGSTVKNQQGEKLGKIEDIVIDFSSDRVAYVVLATDSGILQSEKLHAVPLRAFQCSADGTSVTLNTDKEKLTRSEGFDKNNWPSLNTATWGAEPFWKDTQGTDLQGRQDLDQQNKSYNDPARNQKELQTIPQRPLDSPK